MKPFNAIIIGDTDMLWDNLWTAPSRDLTVQVHTIIRTTIAQFYVNQAVCTPGVTRAKYRLFCLSIRHGSRDGVWGHG